MYSVLPKLRRIPALSALTMSHNNIVSLQQLNRLAVFRNIVSLTVNDNPVNSLVRTPFVESESVF